MLKVKMTFFSSLDQFQKTKSFSTARNHLETTLTNFGPFFKIEMMLKLKSFPNPEEHSGWANIFVIGNGEHKFSVKGARYPSMYLRAVGGILPTEFLPVGFYSAEFLPVGY